MRLLASCTLYCSWFLATSTLQEIMWDFQFFSMMTFWLYDVAYTWNSTSMSALFFVGICDCSLDRELSTYHSLQALTFSKFTDTKQVASSKESIVGKPFSPISINHTNCITLLNNATGIPLLWCESLKRIVDIHLSYWGLSSIVKAELWALSVVCKPNRLGLWRSHLESNRISCPRTSI